MTARAAVTDSFPLLNGYRAIAAFMVLTTHVAFNTGEILTPVLGPVLGRMDFGVTLFFLLSGFLLYRPWARSAMSASPGPRLGTYALRRAARILPAYWLMVAVVLLFLPEIQPVRWQAWPVHLGMLHIYLPGFTLEGLTQTWSLATEVAFYALLPLLAWVAGCRHRGNASSSARWQLAVLIACFGIALIFTVLRVWGVLGDSLLAAYWLPGFIDWFALGMALAVVQVRLTLSDAPPWMQSVRQIARATPWCLLIAVGLYVIATTPLAGPLTFDPASPNSLVIKHVLYGVIAVFLLLPGFLGRWGDESSWARSLRNPIVVYLGTISYGVFLWHLVLLRFVQGWLDIPIFGGGFWMVWPLVVVMSIGIASASWFTVERPLQAWAHRPRPSVRSSSSAAAQAQ